MHQPSSVQRVGLALVIGALLPSVAQSMQTPASYYVNRSGQVFCKVTTQVPKLLAPTPGIAASGLADDDPSRVLYLVDGVTLSQWPYGSNSPATSLGSLTFNGGPHALVSLAHHNGALYGTTDVATEGLYAIDVVTLTTTLLYTFSTNAIDLGGLDVDPATGIFYGSNDDPSYVDPQNATGRGIVALDLSSPMTPIEAKVFPYPVDPAQVEIADIDGVAFDPHGFIYLIEDEPAPLHCLTLATGLYDPAPPQNGFTTVELSAGGTHSTLGIGGIGTNYCAAVANSTGFAASMSATGSAAVFDNDVTLAATNLPTNSFGYFLTSATQGFVPNVSGSQGALCLGGGIGRFVGPGQIRNSGGAGAFSLVIDLTLHPTPMGLVTVLPGQTWNFTAWYRDAIGGMPTSNFTDGYQIDFL